MGRDGGWKKFCQYRREPVQPYGRRCTGVGATPHPLINVGHLARSVAAWTKFCQSTLQGGARPVSATELPMEPRHALLCCHALYWQNFVHPQYSAGEDETLC